MPIDIDFLEIDTCEDIELKFEKIAKKLFKSYGIKLGDNVYRFIEIEFYLNHPEHEDPSVHCSEQQKNFGTWYFHREKQATLNFTFKGIDLVFGKDEYYGGILIRAIQNINEENEVYGPSNTVKRMLEEHKVKEVKELGEKRYKLRGPIKLINFKEEIEEEDFDKHKKFVSENGIYRGPRIGLKNYDKEWLDIKYRYRLGNRGKEKKKLEKIN